MKKARIEDPEFFVAIFIERKKNYEKNPPNCCLEGLSLVDYRFEISNLDLMKDLKNVVDFLSLL